MMMMIMIRRRKIYHDDRYVANDLTVIIIIIIIVIVISHILSLLTQGPWSVTFSYGRALQQSTLKTWAGKAENVVAAQNALLARAQANSEANLGKYVAGSQPSADGTLFVKGYKY